MPTTQEILVPDIGDFAEVDVVDIAIHVGDAVIVEQPLVTLESDKAALEVPSPVAGIVRQIHVAVGAKVSEGTRIATVEVSDVAKEPDKSDGAGTSDRPAEPAGPAQSAGPAEPAQSGGSGGSGQSDKSDGSDSSARSDASDESAQSDPADLPYAGPSVRRLARQLGVELAHVEGTGVKGRIRPEDVHSFVRNKRPPTVAEAATPAVRNDMQQFGPVDIVPLTRIQKHAARSLVHSWTTIPHVTHFDEADITDLEAFRRQQAAEADKAHIKLTLLAFIVRASAAALLRFPRCNASLMPDGDSLALRRYVNLGCAVDTDAGLLVPVLRDADKKTILQLARELADLSSRARAGKATPADLHGATFTISSLGGIGGTHFTPIINSPEVAILGVSRAQTRPVYRDGQWVPRLLLPLSLSYDHRVIDGAAAARFTRHVCELLEDLRRILL